MWCIGELTEEYRPRMYELLALYARPYDPAEPAICIDEKTTQLPRETQRLLRGKLRVPPRQDYEYERAGTCNIFVAVEPRGGTRLVQVTEPPTNENFLSFVSRMLRRGYSEARKVRLLLDNLNAYLRAGFVEVLGKDATTILRPMPFHYCPVHASWLNMAES